MDLKDFFGSVRGKQVVRIFRKFGFPPGTADLLTRLCMYQDSLPQGAPTSPYLANISFLPVDLVISKMCERQKIRYSRYADDLTFSRKKPLPEMLHIDVERVVIRHGFEVNRKKTRNSRPGQAHYVTGFVVSEKVQPDRANRKILRAMFHNALSHPERFGSRKSELQGWASYVNGYDAALGRKYLKIAESIGMK
jgi:RNA-directed DNA polymerase